MRRVRVVPEKITAEWLQRIGACEVEVREFERLWPRGAKVTLRNVRKAQEYELDLEWLVNFMPKHLRKHFEKACCVSAEIWWKRWYMWRRQRDAGKISLKELRRRIKQLDDRNELMAAKAFVDVWNRWSTSRGSRTGKERG